MIVEVEARCYAATCSVLGRVEEHSLQQVNLAEEGGEAGGGVRCGKPTLLTARLRIVSTLAKPAHLPHEEVRKPQGQCP